MNGPLKKLCKIRATVVAQLVERLLPVPEIHCSNPGKLY